MTFWGQRNSLFPIYVGVHFVKLLVLNKGKLSFSSPNLMHQDGEAFTFAHLLSRYNVDGGVNYISTPDYANRKINDIPQDKIISQFEMFDIMDSYGVCDELVSHYVSPIKLKNPLLDYGVREIILIDFSPLIQKLN
jgi:hypothetical protein